MTTPPSYPRIGSLIDDGRFRLVSVLGKGGYGFVYKAVDTLDMIRPFYAVKCLPRSQASQQCHAREITLHQRVSDHPFVVDLSRVVEDDEFVYLIMEYGEDSDLFTQILIKQRYMGKEIYIKNIFLQILDVVEHCHSLGVYHRDLKPENFVCFEGGFRVGLTDFGLATTDSTSTEFHTGSIFYMSPEIQAPALSFEGVYSPQSCDIWSLGIILLNLITGRNPWDIARWDDAAFRSFHQNPYQQLTKLLPVSAEVNEVLVMMLSMEWRARPSIAEIRDAFRKVDKFYSKDVVFEGGLAKLPWESDRYKRSVRRKVEVGDGGCRPCERNLGNQLRKKVYRKKVPLFEEGNGETRKSSVHTPAIPAGNTPTPGNAPPTPPTRAPPTPPGHPDSSDDSSSSSSSGSISTRSGGSPVLPPVAHKPFKLRSKTPLGSILRGFQNLFRVGGRKAMLGPEWVNE